MARTIYEVYVTVLDYGEESLVSVDYEKLYLSYKSALRDYNRLLRKYDGQCLEDDGPYCVGMRERVAYK